MPDGLPWAEVNAAFDRDLEHLKSLAHRLYGQMVAHVATEAARTGAKLSIMPPGTVLPKPAGDAPLALRMDVTAGTALYARQPHVGEPAGEKHRSWPVNLKIHDGLPDRIRRGLSRMVREVARLQGHDVASSEPELQFDRSQAERPIEPASFERGDRTSSRLTPPGRLWSAQAGPS